MATISEMWGRVSIKSLISQALAKLTDILIGVLHWGKSSPDSSQNVLAEPTKGNDADQLTCSQDLPVKRIPTRRITKTLPKIDSFLIHDFNFNIIEQEENPHVEASSSPFLLPMLIEISNPNWDSEVPDYKEFYRTEYMIGCYGSIETIKVLSQDPDVIRVKVADVG